MKKLEIKVTMVAPDISEKEALDKINKKEGKKYEKRSFN